MIKDVLIVCLANICRSPMGEYLFKNHLDSNMNINIHSAGLHALVGYSCDASVINLMGSKGIDLSAHRARQLTRDLVFSSELILTMSIDQQKEIENKYPSACGRVHRIGKWGEFDVLDPYGRPLEIFEQAYALLNQGVNDWCQRLWI